METKSLPLFGTLAVQEGFASEAEVEVALVAQKETNGSVGGVETPIGQILLEMGALNQAQIEAVLAAQVRYRGTSAVSERMPEPPPPAPRPAVETSSPRLVQESGPAPSINDELVAEPRILKPGDRLTLGGASFRFEGDLRTAPVVVPAAPAAAAAPASAAPPVEKAADAPAARGLLRSLDGLVSRILPKVHNHRKYVLAAAFLGLLSIVLPWRIAQNGNTVVGLQGPGWLTFWLLAAAAGTAALTWTSRPIAKVEWLVIASTSGLALLASIWKLASAPAWAAGRGVGLYLALISAIALHAVAWLVRRFPSTAAVADQDKEPVALRLARKFHGFLRNFSGASAKEKAAQIQRRDELLQEIGREALAANPAGPEAAAAKEMLEKVAAAETAAKTDIKARAALKSAEGKAKRAIAKLGRQAVDKAASIPGSEAPKIAELLALEEKIGKSP